MNKEDEVVVVIKDPAPDSFMRYENNLERQIGRTFDQLDALRRVRLVEPTVQGIGEGVLLGLPGRRDEHITSGWTGLGPSGFVTLGSRSRI